MGALILSLIPVTLGIILSPLAIIALIAVLFSANPRPNSAAFLGGWLVGIAGSMTASYIAFSVFEVNERRDPPVWVPIVHLTLGAVMVVGAWFVITRERDRLHGLAAASSPDDIARATPRLPSVLTQVETFNARRCFALGAGLFVLNPVDLSCAIAASLDLRLSVVSGTAQLGLAAAFVCVAAISIAAPVMYLWLRGDAAAAPLEKLRLWVATNTKLLNAALLIVIAIMQLAKGISGL